MSSGEGAEEAAKDAADIATFFKSGKPETREAAGHCSDGEVGSHWAFAVVFLPYTMH